MAYIRLQIDSIKIRRHQICTELPSWPPDVAEGPSILRLERTSDVEKYFLLNLFLPPKGHFNRASENILIMYAKTWDNTKISMKLVDDYDILTSKFHCIIIFPWW